MVNALLENQAGKTGGTYQSDEFYKLLRSAEMKGIATQPEKLQQFIDSAFSYIVAFGGKLSAADYQMMARRGGAAWMHMDPQKAMGPMSVLAADVGGSAAGQAAMSLYQFQQGAMTYSRQQGAIMRQLGLLDMNKVKIIPGSGRLQVEPGAVTGSIQYANDLPGWVQNVVSPAAHLRAGQMAAEGKGDEAALYEALMQKLMPNRNVSKLGLMFSDPGFRDQIAKDLGLAQQVVPIQQAYQNYTQTNPTGVEKAYNEQWVSMMSALGKPFMSVAIPIMREMTHVFQEVGKLANQNPEIIKRIAEGIAALGVGLAALSVTAVAAFAGLPGLIAGLGAAAAALSPKLRSALGEFGEAMLAGDKVKAKAAAWQAAAVIYENAATGLAVAVGLGIDALQALVDGVKAFANEVMAAAGHLMGAPYTHPYHDAHPFFRDRGVYTPTPLPGYPAPQPFIPQIPPSQGIVPAPSMPVIPQIAPNQSIFGPSTTAPVPNPFLPQNFAPPVPAASLGMLNFASIAAPGASLQGRPWETSGGGGTVTVPVHNVIQLNGQAIAETVRTFEVNSLIHPRQSDLWDGRSGFGVPSWSPLSL